MAKIQIKWQLIARTSLLKFPRISRLRFNGSGRIIVSGENAMPRDDLNNFLKYAHCNSIHFTLSLFKLAATIHVPIRTSDS